jgi:5-methylthioadenosine/S-adenosylhomocysteine deaminase
MSFILADACVVTVNSANEIHEGASVLVRGDRIADIGPKAELTAAEPSAEVIDCRSSILMPGMVNTHTHLFQTLLKGPGDDMVLKDWFTSMTGPAAVELTAPDIRAAAMHGCVESIRSGVTTLVEFMYAHPRPGLTRAVIDAYEVTGMRGFVCRGFFSTGAEYGVSAALIETPEKALADARALALEQNRPGGRVQVGLAPCVIWGLDEACLRETRKVADELGLLVTMHVSETPFEVECSIRSYGRTETTFLSDIGFLNQDVLAVHCVHCTSTDIATLRRHGTKISHNPCSNMYLASGVAPIPEMLNAGMTVGLASDGPASSNNHSLFQAMKFAALMQKGVHGDPTVITAQQVLRMATIDGARAIGLDSELGSIEVGKKADLALLDMSDFFASPIHNPVSAIVYSALGHEPTLVVIDGKIVMRDREVLTVDQRHVRQEAQQAAASLASRAKISSRAKFWCQSVDGSRAN